MNAHRNHLGLVDDPNAVDEAWLDTVFEWIKAREPKLFVDNAWTAAASGRDGETFDPSTGAVVGRYAIADAVDVGTAVASARAAQREWAALTVERRSQYLLRLRDAYLKNLELFAVLDAINAGLPVRVMRVDVEKSAQQILEWTRIASGLAGDVLQNGGPGLHFTRYAPYGVIARIVAYNHPILFAVKAIAPAILAGNAVVLKPAEQAPFSAMLLAELIAEVLPPGIVNIVPGDAATGEALVTHPHIRRVAFTGSVRTGQLIQQAAARDSIRSVSLELGGKNAMIVFPDASVADIVKEAVFGMNLRANAGQSCGSTSRLYVHSSLYDQVVDGVKAELEALKLGPAYRRDTDLGPVISSVAVSRINGVIGSGVEDGARLVTGGPDDPRIPADGNFVAPTLFADVPKDARIAREEIFGPVIAAASWDDYEEMIEVVVDSEYGLTASIWTNDLDVALQTASRMETGYVWINESTTHHFGTPFGGWKNSGVGREECLDEYRSYLQVQSVHVKARPSRISDLLGTAAS